MKIFVQIASYRDPQLIPTIKDMLANAKKPNNLVIGIARQYSDEDGFDNLDEYKDDKRFRILDIPYQDAKGVCWERHQVQQCHARCRHRAGQVCGGPGYGHARVRPL